MTYPFAHRIDTSHPYVKAVDTDIRKTFERFSDAETPAKPVLRSVSAPPAARGRQEQDRGFPALLTSF